MEQRVLQKIVADPNSTEAEREAAKRKLAAIERSESESPDDSLIREFLRYVGKVSLKELDLCRGDMAQLDKFCAERWPPKKVNGFEGRDDNSRVRLNDFSKILNAWRDLQPDQDQIDHQIIRAILTSP